MMYQRQILHKKYVLCGYRCTVVMKDNESHLQEVDPEYLYTCTLTDTHIACSGTVLSGELFPISVLSDLFHNCHVITIPTVAFLS